MSAITELAIKIKNNFTKAIKLLKLNFAKIYFLPLRRKKYLAIFFAVLILVGIGLTVPQGFTHAAWYDSVGDWIMNNIIYRIIYFIFWVLFYLAYAIAYLGAGFLNTSLNPEIMKQVLTSSAVATGWTIFRDIANLFFILILLFIAFGTIVRSQSFNLKNLLPKLIIAVFLINFSNVIAGIIIDFGNIFMYGVLKWMNCTASNPTCATDFFASLMNVIDGFDAKFTLKAGLLSPSAQDAVGMLVATIYTFIYGLILLALSTFLIIRVTAFALLIILSPLAFVGEVFPGLQQLSSKWWDNLIKYTLFGPIFALLLYVSGLIAQGTIITVSGSFWGNTNPALGTFGELYVTIIQNIIPLIFLLAIIPITQELGIAGANAVLGSTVLAGAGFLAGASRYVGGAVDRFMARGAIMEGKDRYSRVRRGLANLSPGAWKRAIKDYEAKGERDYDIVRAKRAQTIEKATDPYYTLKRKLWEKRGPVIDEGEKAKERAAAEYVEKLDIRDSNERIEKIKGFNREGKHYEVERLLIENALDNATDELLDREMGDHTPEKLAEYLKMNFKDVFSEEKISRLAYEIHKGEKKNGNHSYAEIGKYDKDPVTGKWGWMFNEMDTLTKITQQKDAVVKSFNSVDEFNRIRTLKKSAVVDASNNLTAVGEAMLRQIKGEGLKQIKRMSPKVAIAVHDSFIAKFGTTGIGAPGTPRAGRPIAHPATPPELKEVWEQIIDDFKL